jgi:hypothetical protein
MKKVQIDFDLFRDLISYFLVDDKSKEENIKKALKDKLDALERRELYSQYKNSKGEEREENRKKYLDSKGILKDFRTKEEERI